jgi:hypothetical protein
MAHVSERLAIHPRTDRDNQSKYLYLWIGMMSICLSISCFLIASGKERQQGNQTVDRNYKGAKEKASVIGDYKTAVNTMISSVEVKDLNGFRFQPTGEMRVFLRKLANEAYQNQNRLELLKQKMKDIGQRDMGTSTDLALIKADISTREIYLIQGFANRFEGIKLLVIGYGNSAKEPLSQRVGIGIAVSIIDGARDLARKQHKAAEGRSSSGVSDARII